MPSRGSYQIANREEGKAAQRDESYKSCVITLLIFFFLCLILILASLPWTRNYVSYSEYSDENFKAAQHHSYNDYPKTTTTREPDEPILVSATTKELETTTEQLDIVNATYSSKNLNDFEQILSIETTTETDETTTEKDEITDSTVIKEFVTEEELFTDSPTTESSELIINFSSTTTTNSAKNDISTTKAYSTNNGNEIDISTTESLDSTTISFTTEKSVGEDKSTTEIIAETATNSTESITTETTTESPITESTTWKAIQSSTTNMPDIFSTEYSSPSKEQVCLTGKCKNMASKILFYMNHTVEPCDDFYEYACGSFEANPQVVERNLKDIAYQRLLKQMKENPDNNASLFSDYYNSCLNYENVNYTERIQLAKTALGRIGRFYTTEEWAKNRPSFTTLIAKLLLHNSAILFDVSPEPDFPPDRYTLKIGPTTYKNPFEIEKTEDPCHVSQFGMEQETVDLGKLYNKYKKCKNDTEKYIQSIAEALTELGAFSELNIPYNISQYIDITVINIDIEIVQNFFAKFPPQNKIQEAHLRKTYQLLPVMELDEKYNLVNWTQLIHLLTMENINPEVKLQIYFYEQFVEGLNSLKQFSEKDEMALYNAVLGLYARNLYNDLVLSNHKDTKEYCLRVATKLLIPEASNLYISSFSNDELTYMSQTIINLFQELKQTLKLKIMDSEWTTSRGRDALIGKLDNLQIAIPNISYFNDSNSTYRKTKANEVSLTDNYFVNSINLMQRYRMLIYAEFYTNPHHPEQIWTHYATPFQTEGLAIYGLNLVIIPFGITDWSMKNDDFSFDYIILATLGNMIARQIAHHYDANGFYYIWNETLNKMSIDSQEFTSSVFEETKHCHEMIYQDKMTMTLPITGQTVYYEISQLTLNERLSEAIGLRLAHDTLDRLRSHMEILPWLDLNVDQLFYLTYAQMYCTKASLTSSYTSLYEDQQLPSRIRVHIAASNNRLLGEAWNCRAGSQIIPSFVCNVFPYFSDDEGASVTSKRK